MEKGSPKNVTVVELMNRKKYIIFEEVHQVQGKIDNGNRVTVKLRWKEEEEMIFMVHNIATLSKMSAATYVWKRQYGYLTDYED